MAEGTADGPTQWSGNYGVVFQTEAEAHEFVSYLAASMGLTPEEVCLPPFKHQVEDVWAVEVWVDHHAFLPWTCSHGHEPHDREMLHRSWYECSVGGYNFCRNS